MSLVAKKAGFVLVPRFPSTGRSSSGSVIDVAAAADRGTVSGADFIAVPAGSVTIPLIQGNGAQSPLAGAEVSNVRGVVTMVSRKTAHSIYDTVEYDSTTTPQWISEDGFFMEAFGSDKDGDSATSDHFRLDSPAFLESKWKDA